MGTPCQSCHRSCPALLRHNALLQGAAAAACDTAAQAGDAPRLLNRPNIPPVVLVRLPLPLSPPETSHAPHASGSVAAAADAQEEGTVTAALGGDGSSSALSAAWRLPQRVEQPFFLRALCHELGHALHYVLSERPQDRSDAHAASSGDGSSGGSSSSSSNAGSPPPLPGSLRSAHFCPVDWREAGPHVLERWCVPLPCTRVRACWSAGTRAPCFELVCALARALAHQRALPALYMRTRML